MFAVAALIALYVATAGVLLLLGMFCLEVLLAILPWPETNFIEPLSRLRFAVLIPAHNEQMVIGRTLQTLLPTLGPKDRVVVVADNCADNTVMIARQAGAEVIERRDMSRRGKAYALDYGLKHLQADPPDAVIFLDADCQVQPDTVRRLGSAAVTLRRPAQGLNLCDPDPQGGPMQTVSGLAFRFKNLVRAIGLFRLTGLCYLTGTGMALPWTLTYNLRLDGDSLVEDMQLGLDLAVAGHPPLLVTQARVDSPLPQKSEAARTQRTRWEHGHLRTLLTQVPRLLYQGAKRARPDVAGLALDLAIPPMSLLAGLWLLTLIAALIGIPCGATAWPALFLAIGGSCLFLAVAAGWLIHCRKVIPLSALCAVPMYVARKVPIYLQFLRRPQRGWVRTERDAAASKSVAARPKRA